MVAEGDTPDGVRWQVRAGGTADEYLHAWKVISADGEWDGSGVGGPCAAVGWALGGRLLLDQESWASGSGALRVHVQVGVTLFFVPTTGMVRLRSALVFDAGGQPLAPPEPALRSANE